MAILPTYTASMPHLLLIHLCLCIAILTAPSRLIGYEFESRSYQIITDMDARKSKEFGKVMDAYYIFLSKTFGMPPQAKAKLPLRIFSDRTAFKSYINTRSKRTWPDWVYGVYYYGNPNELVIYWDGKYWGIFYHEGFHQFAHLCWPEVRNWPDWFNEGCASFLETCVYKKGRISHTGKLRSDYTTKFKEYIRKNKNFDLTAFMNQRTNWNASGYDYAISACLISTMLSNSSGKLKQYSQKFFRTLKETQDYQQSITAFTEEIPSAKLQEYLIKVMK